MLNIKHVAIDGKLTAVRLLEDLGDKKFVAELEDGFKGVIHVLESKLTYAIGDRTLPIREAVKVSEGDANADVAIGDDYSTETPDTVAEQGEASTVGDTEV